MRGRKPVVLAILDGWGLRADREANAPALAHTPTIDRLNQQAPCARLSASGADVGLPDGQMGNSEVGHTNIGAGRVVLMDLPKIDRAIADGSFATNAALVRFGDRLVDGGGAAHLLGLASPGGVHAHERHMVAAAQALVARGIPVLIHAITDGRDVPPKSALEQITALEAALPAGARIVTLCGRFHALDRDKRWGRVKAATDLILHGAGRHAESPAEAIEAAYGRGETDEFIAPTRLPGWQPPRKLDGLFCLNFRADRAREILHALADPGFRAYETGERAEFAARLGMVDYSAALDPLFDAMYAHPPIENTLGAWVSAQGRRQFRLAETEKYPHVTFFLNGGVEKPETGEAREMPPSPKVKTYDHRPEMAAEDVTERLVHAIGVGYDLIVVNYANPDMVGHTGVLSAAVAACEAVDAGLGRALDALAEAGGAAIVTSDHGNCELMVDPETGGPHTAHTTNPVPVWMVGGPEGAALADGRLADLAPTLLELMELAQPPDMTGRSLIRSRGG